MSTRYLELLCSFNPDGVYPFLEASLRPNSGVVGLDAAITQALVRDHNIMDARALLLNVNNQPSQARQLSCEFVRTTLKRLSTQLWCLSQRYSASLDVDSILTQVTAPCNHNTGSGNLWTSSKMHTRLGMRNSGSASLLEHFAASYGHSAHMNDTLSQGPKALDLPNRTDPSTHPVKRQAAAQQMHADVDEGVKCVARVRHALQCAMGFLVEMSIDSAGRMPAEVEARVSGWVNLLAILLEEHALMCNDSALMLTRALRLRASDVAKDDAACNIRRVRLLNANPPPPSSLPKTTHVQQDAMKTGVVGDKDLASAKLIAPHYRAFLRAVLDDAVRQMALHVEVDLVMQRLLAPSHSSNAAAATLDVEMEETDEEDDPAELPLGFCPTISSEPRSNVRPLEPMQNEGRCATKLLIL